MPNIVKFLLMALAWAVLFFGTRGCIEEHYCHDAGAVNAAEADQGAVAPVPAPAELIPLYSSFGSDAVGTDTGWNSELQGLYDKFQTDPNQALDVTGFFYAGEVAPDDSENMGYYRAGEIQKLLVAKGIPAENIRLLSTMIDDDRPADGAKFDAGDFAWGRMIKAGDANQAELVDVGDGKVKIRFPFDASKRTLGKEIEDYLKLLAARVAESKETISIVGHTDNVDTEAYNMKLGQRRADFVRDRLVSYGVSPSLITTSSQGENSPEATNATAEGRRINRRAELTLNMAQ